MQIRLLLYRLIEIYQLLILIECILSWFPRREGGLLADIYGALSTLVDPYLNLFRRFIPPMGGLDWSPVLAILVLQLVERIVI